MQTEFILYVSNQEKSKQFYEKLLGIKLDNLKMSSFFANKLDKSTIFVL